MKPPETITVGPYRYTVVVDDDEILRRSREQSTDLLGCAEHRQLTITLRPEQAPDMLAETLLHELLHCLNEMTGVTSMFDDGDSQESFVARYSPALLDTLRRNPDLVRYLLGDGSAGATP